MSVNILETSKPKWEENKAIRKKLLRRNLNSGKSHICKLVHYKAVIKCNGEHCRRKKKMKLSKVRLKINVALIINKKFAVSVKFHTNKNEFSIQRWVGEDDIILPKLFTTILESMFTMIDFHEVGIKMKL